MPLYVGDYLSDTAHLTIEQSGAYLHLLMYSWRTSRLPADPKGLAQLCRVSVLRWRREIGPKVLPYFEEVDGVLRNARLEIERAKSRENSQRQREKSRKRHSPNIAHETWENKGLGSAAAQPRDIPSPSPSPSQGTLESQESCKTRASPACAGSSLFGMPADDELSEAAADPPLAAPRAVQNPAPPPRVARPVLLNGTAVAFEAFWSAYPHRLSGNRLVKPDRAAAETAFAAAAKRMSPGEIVEAVKRFPFDRDRPQYIQGPAVWLRRGAYLSDLGAEVRPQAAAKPGKLGWMTAAASAQGPAAERDYPGMTIDGEQQ